jgi:hypothetical protein
MAKLTPVKSTTKSKANDEVDTQKLILEELKKQTAYMDRTDWKLWIIMNVLKVICEENGYRYDIETEAQAEADE